MRIGFMLSAVSALSGPGDGVRAQAQRQAAALERQGHEVLRLNCWQPPADTPLDVLQFFQGGFPFYAIHRNAPRLARCISFAPIIDTNEPNWKYRLAARLGHITPKIYTIPGVFRDQARLSDVVIARSSHERDRIVDGLGIEPRKVHIVLNGVDPPPSADPAPARQALDLPGDFLLHVSAYTQGRKNVLRLLDAVGPTDLPLVIAGSATDGRTLEQIRQRCARYANVRVLGFQTRAMLDSLYAGCRVFCLPSIHEGTGLVALEAASFGAGVVITQHGGPVDYFADLAYYVDPLDVHSIRAAVRAAWDQPRGEQLRRAVGRLTWDRSARELVAAYRSHMPDRPAGDLP